MRKLKRFSVGKQFEVENKHRYFTNKLQNGIGAEGAYHYFDFGFRGAENESRKLKRFSVRKQFEVENKHRYSTNKLQNGIGAEGAYQCASWRFYCGYAACSNSRFGF